MSIDVQVGPLPNCERCGEQPATTKLVFTYRGEEYAEHFYCEPCCDLAWEEGVQAVDAKAATLKEHGL